MRTKKITALVSIIAVLTVFSASSGIAVLSEACTAARYESSRGDAMSAMKPDNRANASVGNGTDCALRNVPEPHDFVWHGMLPGNAFGSSTDKPGGELVSEPAVHTDFSEFMCGILRRAP